MWRRKKSLRDELVSAQLTLAKVRDTMRSRIEAGDLDLDDVVFRAEKASNLAVEAISETRRILFHEDDDD